ncbi:hypothetical protein XENTR_v10008084 [Xenopus tropicalis]|nr:hypothetical protein XENTR_v10008084 [Xenopus tropicalis]KAE8614264.1 hypothetical protein XENTR_v10008084 [Xenopus tropicalis]
MSILTGKIFRGFSITASNVRKHSSLAPHRASLSILSATFKFPFPRFTLKYFSERRETILSFLSEISLTFNPRSFAKFPINEPFCISSKME